MAPLLFARLQADVGLRIRRGAWYRVLDLGDLEAVIDVNRQPVRVLRAWLEFERRPPPRWSVVAQPSQGRRGPPELAPQYGVCPGCRGRASLAKRARTRTCPRCKQEFEVNWAERYLAEA